MEEFCVSHQIEKIIKIKNKIINEKEEIYLLIKWKNFDEKYNSWEPLANLNFKSAIISLKELKKNFKNKNNINSLILTNKAINIWKKNNQKFCKPKILKNLNHLEILKEKVISRNNSSNLNDSLLNIDVFSISDFFDNKNSKFEKKNINFLDSENLNIIYKNIISKKRKLFIEKDIHSDVSKKIVKRQNEILDEFDLIKKNNNKIEFFEFFFKNMKKYDKLVNKLENEFFKFNDLKKKKILRL